MKKLLAKIKNKRLNGNISLLVILILLASSVISLLSINQIQRLLTYWNMTFNYFRAFYLAKAGTELWLTEVYNRGNGFDNTILSGSALVTWNLLSEYSWFNPYFYATITWHFEYLTNNIKESNKCESGNEIVLWTGEWIMLSLFEDEYSNKDTDKVLGNYTWVLRLSDSKIKNLNIERDNWEWWTIEYFTFWLFDYSNEWDMNNIFVKTWYANYLQSFLRDHVDSLGDRKYLTIKNPWTSDEVVKFCIKMWGNLIPYSNSLITVFWHYGDMEVWIQSIVKKWVPDWTLNVLWWNDSS